MGKRRKYTKDFKESAVQLYHSSGKSAYEVAEGLGIPSENLSRWIKESQEEEVSSKKAFTGQGNPRDEEVARLKKENADLRETNEILKKAMAIFTARKP